MGGNLQTPRMVAQISPQALPHFDTDALTPFFLPKSILAQHIFWLVYFSRLFALHIFGLWHQASHILIPSHIFPYLALQYFCLVNFFLRSPVIMIASHLFTTFWTIYSVSELTWHCHEMRHRIHKQLEIYALNQFEEEEEQIIKMLMQFYVLSRVFNIKKRLWTFGSVLFLLRIFLPSNNPFQKQTVRFAFPNSTLHCRFERCLQLWFNYVSILNSFFLLDKK